MISLENLKIVTPLQKLLKNLGDLGKLIVAKGFKKWPNKLPNLVTLLTAYFFFFTNLFKTLSDLCEPSLMIQKYLSLFYLF